MFCIFCKNNDTEVVETRLNDLGNTVRRRRQCGKCSKRFTTYERIETLPIIISKRDGRRERFDEDKLMRGILKSTEKTKISLEQVRQIIEDIKTEIKQEEVTEIESSMIGNLVAKKLKKIDKIAYIRFASVFRRFVDVDDFEKELKKLL